MTTTAGKSLCVMQPYFMPYIGYWQLLATADRFIVLDDVAFIPRGWIHRNRILSKGAAALFTLPVMGGSQNRLICELERDDPERWSEKFSKTLQTNYGNAPHFDATMSLLHPIITNPEPNLAAFIEFSLRGVARELGITTGFSVASVSHPKGCLSGQDRILDICRREEAHRYLNLPGGAGLYDSAAFEADRIGLHFITPANTKYPQRSASFISRLSIIDILMHAGREATRDMLADFTVA